MKIIGPVRDSRFAAEQKNVSELVHGAEPTPGDAIIVVVKADNCAGSEIAVSGRVVYGSGQGLKFAGVQVDRKSTRRNSSHRTIAYAVLCVKKKKRHRGASAHLRTAVHRNKGQRRAHAT